MSNIPDSIPKHSTLKPAEDYYGLRREGIGFIEKMGSQLWTDYNTHDPGITILEALCYAITDLAYRTSWDIKDLLAPASSATDPKQPFPNQAFFTAREILTVNPVTPDDYRRLLIDLPAIRNAWVFCKQCACDFSYYAWCEEDQLKLAYQKPLNEGLQPKKVDPMGLYEILLELENDPELGDLNDRKIDYAYSVFDIENKAHTVNLEMRFPDWALLDAEQRRLFLGSDSFNITELRFGATQLFDVYTDDAFKNDINDTDRNKYLHDHWRNILYVSFELAWTTGANKVTLRFENATLRIFGDATAKNQSNVADMKRLFEGIFIQRYRAKRIKAHAAIAEAKASLHNHRNLAEDYCRITIVNIEDVIVCADIEVAADADIERVQALIWFEIEQYFNPPVPFYTLQEMLADDVPVEAIFNGPELSNGFIKADELHAAGLKTVLRTSDIINQLMAIEGVIAVNNLLLSKYDAEGNVVKGAADPTWQTNGIPVFDPKKSSAAWLLYVSPLHQPRFQRGQSRFLFYKNGLPFLPRMDEAKDTLTQLRGESERPKNNNTPKDLTIPAGSYRHPEDYYPLQYSFPTTYGIGPEGLPSHVLPQRRAQAKQLKAYLMVFEQILGNALAQVAHVADLFSLDPLIKRTYFVKELTDTVIKEVTDIVNHLDKAQLEAITETSVEYLERRNGFLDHLLARFAEQFSEYALLLNNVQGRQIAQSRLIEDKIAFLKAYPFISHNRGKAFNFQENPCAPNNYSGLKKRINLLLGSPDLSFSQINQTNNTVNFPLIDGNGRVWLAAETGVTTLSFQDVMKQLMQIETYLDPKSTPFQLLLKDKDGKPLAKHPNLFKTLAELQAFRDELLNWSANERSIVVEHLLLRPKFPGDALYPACTDGACKTCGDEDPYSFRLTFVMPGWTSPYNVNMDLRRFAERTLQQETPAHLLSKICWVGNDGFVENLCDPVINQLEELLISKGVTASSGDQVCACAKELYNKFSVDFKAWYEDKTLVFIHPEALKIQLEQIFPDEIPSSITCVAGPNPVWSDIKKIMVAHFQQIVLYGWQFERFEAAWCQWLEANAEIDWAAERLRETVQAILKANLQSGTAADLCHCATAILAQFGTAFYDWMELHLSAGDKLGAKDFIQFTPQTNIIILHEVNNADNNSRKSSGLPCDAFMFNPGTASTIETFLIDRYKLYTKASYHLRLVVKLLSKLRNTYPGATLHDCDDGSDQNPVRLDNTALGNNPL